MKIKQIIVVKETRQDEGRVSLTPDAVFALTKTKLPIFVESEAGKLAGFTDKEYIQAGAEIFTLNSSSFPSHSLIFRVKCPSAERELVENKLLPKTTIMMGFLDPLNNDINHINRWKTLGIQLISLELLPLTADDSKNAQAAMSRFAGRLALHDAIKHYSGSLAKKVTVIGTGPAGFGAALAAKDLQLPVQLFGRRESYRQNVEDAGITYFVLPESNANDFIRHHLINQTIIITAARSVGKKAPVLIDETTLAMLPESTAIVDLSTGEGSSVVGSKHDEIVVTDKNISIINVSGYPKAEPRAASVAFANCMVNLLFEIITPNDEIDLNHPLLKHQYSL